MASVRSDREISMPQTDATDYSVLREQYAEQKRQELRDEEGGIVKHDMTRPAQIHLTFPDGRKKTVQVKAGHQVAYLKALLQEEDGLPSGAVKLVFNGREMIDPLSFTDYKGMEAGRECAVSVELLQ